MLFFEMQSRRQGHTSLNTDIKRLRSKFDEVSFFSLSPDTKVVLEKLGAKFSADIHTEGLSFHSPDNTPCYGLTHNAKTGLPSRL